MSFAMFLMLLSIYIGLIATTFFILSYRADKKDRPLYKDSELPKVSVIIPAWNEEKSIAKTIESIKASKYPRGKLEIIVVDDGSKDKTYEIAKKYKSKHIKVFSKKNGGKGTALNYGIKKSSGKIVVSMDADTFVDKDALIGMVRLFKNPNVMCTMPSMLILNPKGILQRVQQAEYLFGLFIRKSFASMNAVHVTPGAFSAYRRTFFEKHGYYDEGNITEDLEMALRIQSLGYEIDYSLNSNVYTIAPKKFGELTIQRRRWYYGLMKNTWKYRKIISPKYGDMGIFVIPIAWISIFFSVFLLNYMLIKGIFDIKKEILFLMTVNFDFSSLFSFNKYFIERLLFNIFTNNIFIFLIFLVVILTSYMKFATKSTGKVKNVNGTVALYFIFFAMMFGFWWTISIFYLIFNRKVSWR